MNTDGSGSRIRFRFEKLEVWQDARRLNLEIYQLASRLPAGENYGLGQQIRRASVSISANIAEGAGRNSDRDFAHFLEQSYGSAMELASHLFLAGDLGYLEGRIVEPALARIDQLAIRVAALNRSLAVKFSKVKL
jgi:four helix bundle protein